MYSHHINYSNNCKKSRTFPLVKVQSPHMSNPLGAPVLERKSFCSSQHSTFRSACFAAFCEEYCILGYRNYDRHRCHTTWWVRVQQAKIVAKSGYIAHPQNLSTSDGLDIRINHWPQGVSRELEPLRESPRVQLGVRVRFGP
jgi:hypothetical protein